MVLLSWKKLKGLRLSQKFHLPLSRSNWFCSLPKKKIVYINHIAWLDILPFFVCSNTKIMQCVRSSVILLPRLSLYISLIILVFFFAYCVLPYQTKFRQKNCRNFGLSVENFVRRIFCPTKYFVRQNFVLHIIQCDIFFDGTFYLCSYLL